MTNCMMLAAIPGAVGDGGEVMVGSQRTHVGKAATHDTLERLLAGVPGSEITGVDLTPDHKTLFVGIQHPGESGSSSELQSNWPAASGADATQPGYATNRPRSATIAITRIDGGDIGAECLGPFSTLGEARRGLRDSPTGAPIPIIAT